MTKTYTPPEAAEILGVSHKTVINWIKSGKLEAETEMRGFRPFYKITQSELDRIARELKKADQSKN